MSATKSRKRVIFTFDHCRVPVQAVAVRMPFSNCDPRSCFGWCSRIMFVCSTNIYVIHLHAYWHIGINMYLRRITLTQPTPAGSVLARAWADCFCACCANSTTGQSLAHKDSSWYRYCFPERCLRYCLRPHDPQSIITVRCMHIHKDTSRANWHGHKHTCIVALFIQSASRWSIYRCITRPTPKRRTRPSMPITCATSWQKNSGRLNPSWDAWVPRDPNYMMACIATCAHLTPQLTPSHTYDGCLRKPVLCRESWNRNKPNYAHF